MLAGYIMFLFACLIAVSFFYAMTVKYARLVSLMSTMIREHCEIQKILLAERGNTGKGYFEKRRYLRLKVKNALKAKVIHRESVDYAEAVEISYGGTLLKTVKSLPLGAIVNLSMHLPNISRSFSAGSVNMLGRVVRVFKDSGFSPGFKTGVEFVDARNCDRERLISAVDRLSRIA